MARSRSPAWLSGRTLNHKLDLSLVFSYMPPQRVLHVQACQLRFEGFPEGLGFPTCFFAVRIGNYHGLNNKKNKEVGLIKVTGNLLTAYQQRAVAEW